MTIEEILSSGRTAEETISQLKAKTILVPSWGGRHGLRREYDPRLHPVMSKVHYPDIVTSDGIQKVTRVTFDLQRLAAKRMTELVTGIPVNRIYAPENDKQKEVAGYLERILQRNRIDSVNIERCNMLFAGCEVLTQWYAAEERNHIYGFDSALKLRCRNFSPMWGDELYPLFDEYGDMIAMSVAYTRKVGKETVNYFECFAANRYIKWSTQYGDWRVEEDRETTLGKIPCIYMWRPTPIWENTSKTVYEIEWVLSRNGNYLRENSKPLFVLFADQEINYGNEGGTNEEFKSVLQYPSGASAQYITWQQATEALKFHVETLRNLFFTQLQLPDWSYEKMSQQALSGESRKQLFVDAQLKVKDESGRLLEFFDREVNVVKSFMKVALGDSYAADIDALQVETQITPFTINDETDRINQLMAANGNMPIMSQRESIEAFGKSDDVDKTLDEIKAQQTNDIFEPTI